jgi:hypothetical protein
VDRPADPGENPRVPSGHVLSETAGAVSGFSTTPNGSISWGRQSNLSPDSGLHRRGNRNLWSPAASPTSFEFGSRPFNQGFSPQGEALWGQDLRSRPHSRGRRVATGGIFPPVIEESNRG